MFEPGEDYISTDKKRNTWILGYWVDCTIRAVRLGFSAALHWRFYLLEASKEFQDPAHSGAACHFSFLMPFPFIC